VDKRAKIITPESVSPKLINISAKVGVASTGLTQALQVPVVVVAKEFVKTLSILI